MSGKNIIIVSDPQQPFCEQCGDNGACVETFDSACVIYHPNDNAPSELGSINMPNISSLENILEALDVLVTNNFNISITRENTESIEILLSGSASHKVKANLLLSSDAGNAAEIRSSGLYVGGATGSFTAQSGELITVLNGIIFSIV